MGRAPSALSMVNDTSARPRGGRPEVPAKMTSSILPPRSDLAPCSPITQARASTTFDLPDPFGPTMQVMPGSSWSVVAEAKDLKPRTVRLFRYTWAPHRVSGRTETEVEDHRGKPARSARASLPVSRPPTREPARPRGDDRRKMP